MEEQYNDQLPREEGQGIPMTYNQEGSVANIVSQIDPSTIINNLDHALAGEFFNEQVNKWELTSSKKPLVNDECRGAIISYVTGILNNNSTLSIITQQQLGFLMEGVVESITRMFVCNLEEFGFVPNGIGFGEGIYENKGTPDSARMTMVSNMVYSVIFLTLTRGINGMESRKIFSSLSLSDSMNFGNPQQQQGGGNWIGKAFGR
jgi:hypothetical protein